MNSATSPKPPTSLGLRANRSEAESAFPQTNWTLVLDGSNQVGDEPLNNLRHLAQSYWKPLYRFARQRGADHEDAADMVQGFFEHLLTANVFEGLERRESRFRSFLLTCFIRWVGSRKREQRAYKRGGAVTFVTHEDLEAVGKEPAGAEGDSPEQCFDRRWARAIYDNAIKALDDEIYESKKPAYLIALKHTIIGSVGERVDIATVADQFNQTPAAARKAAFDLRERFGFHLRRAVRAVVASDEDVDQELRYMISLLSRSV